MPRKPRKPRLKKQIITPEIREYLETGVHTGVGSFFLAGDRDGEAKAWKTFRLEILLDWVDRFPCTRPWAWWRYDAPRWKRKFNNAWFNGRLPEPRHRLSGTGTPSHEVLSYMPRFEKGIPVDWIDQQLVDGYKKDSKSQFRGIAISKDDPPIYESEASYLSRFSLLTEAEEIILKKCPELMKPENVNDIALKRRLNSRCPDHRDGDHRKSAGEGPSLAVACGTQDVSFNTPGGMPG